jgi:hypothetical protein
VLPFVPFLLAAHLRGDQEGGCEENSVKEEEEEEEEEIRAQIV